MYAPQPYAQPYPQPTMQGYAPQPAYPQYAPTPMRRPGNGWWRWALAAGLGGLGIGGAILGKRMEENDKEEIKRNNRRKWIPNFDMDPMTMTTLVASAPKLLHNVLNMKDTISDAIAGKKNVKGAKDTQKINTDLATAFKTAQDSNDVMALKKAIRAVEQSGNKDLIDKGLWKKANSVSNRGYFSESTNYYDRYRDMNFNFPPYMPPQPYPQPYPQPMIQGYAPQPAYYQPRPSIGRTLGRAALGLSALAALGGGAYALKKATAHNQELADSRKPSFINKINVPDLIAPLMGVTGLVENNVAVQNRQRKKKLKAIKEDTKKDIDAILNGQSVATDKDRAENSLGSAYRAKDVAGQLANIAGIALPFAKKFIQHKADQDE